MLKKFRKQLKLFSWLFILIFTVSCSSTGSSSSSDSSSTNNNSSNNSGSGITISGDVDISESDISNLQDSSEEATSSLLALRTISNISSEEDQVESLKKSAVEGATARLYTINDDGELDYTGFETLVENGSYSFDNIELTPTSNANYVVKIKKKGYDAQGNVHMFECEAYVPIDADASSDTPVQANVSPKTTAVSTYVRSKIAESDVVFTAEQVDIIIDLVVDLIDLGVVQEPDVVTISSEDEALFDDDDVELVKNDTAAQLESTLDTNDEILEINKENVVKAQLTKDVSSMTEEEAKTFIKSVFGVASSSNDSSDRGSEGKGNEGPGDFFITQFATAYLNNKTATIEDLAQALIDSGVNASVSQLSSAIATHTASTLSELYDYYDGEEKPDIDNLPTVKAVFTSNDRISITNNKVPVTLEMNVPQMILIFGIAGLFDDNYQFDPLAFTQHIGFVEIEQNELYIMSSHITPMSMWAPNGHDSHGGEIWDEVDTLYAEIEIFGVDEEGNPLTESDIGDVVIVYPKAGNLTGQALLEIQTDHHDDSQNQDASITNTTDQRQAVLRISTKQSSLQTKEYNSNISENEGNDNHEDMTSSMRYELNPWGNGNQQKSASELITDFETGTVIFKVYDASNSTVLAEVEHNVVRINFSDIQWVFPAGPDMEKVESMGFDPDYEPTIIPLDEGETSIDGGVIKWLKPSASELAEIPDSSELVYSIDIGLTARSKNWEETMNMGDDFDGNYWDWEQETFAYKHIWSSWERGSFIKGTQFKLPITLNQTENGAERNYVTEYEINIRPLLRNKVSKMIEWEGRPSRTNFQVGSPPSWTAAIEGSVTFPAGFLANEVQQNSSAGVWKVGLFKMDGLVDGQWTSIFYALGNNAARQPVTAEATGTILSATLGTTAELQENGVATFTFPSIYSDHNPLSRNSNYSFIVWYDLTAAPNNADWEDVEATAGGIDFSSATIFTQPLEKHYFDNGNVRFDNGAIMYDQWTNTSGKMTILSAEDAEPIELNPFSWYDATNQ